MSVQFDPILGDVRDGAVSLAEQLAGFNSGTTAQQAAFQASVSGVKKYYVEMYRTAGASDTATINAALSAIRADAPSSAVLEFDNQRAYNYDGSARLGPINNLKILGNGANVTRAASAVTRGLLTASTPDTATTLQIAPIPVNWGADDLIAVCAGTSNAQLSAVVRITAIDRVAGTVSVNSAPTLGGATFSVGTKVVKCYQFIEGVPSLTEPNTVWPQGSNKNVVISGFVLDGNAGNQDSWSWRCCSEILLHTEGGGIHSNTFSKTAGECIIGHGFDVGGGGRNVFVDLGGSAVHLSCNDATAAVNQGAVIRGNLFRRTNLKGQAASGHAEGAITFSWGPGNTTVIGNHFDGGSESILGNFGTSSGANASKLLTFVNNICQGYGKIFSAVSASTYGVVVEGNSFHNCGDNSGLSVLVPPENRILGNAVSGGTVLPQRTEDQSGAITPTVIGSGTAGTATYAFRGGVYSVVGGVCMFTLKVRTTAMSGTGNTLIGGLPLQCRTGADLTPVNIFQAAGPVPGAGKQRIGVVQAGTTTIGLREFDTATGAVGNSNAATAVNEYYVSGVYPV